MTNTTYSGAQNAAATITPDGAKDALRRYAKDIATDPLVNSVFALAVHYFQRLESGELAFEQLRGLAGSIGQELLEERATRFREQHLLSSDAGFGKQVTDALAAKATEGFTSFKTLLEKPRGGLVFTGHPTFANPQSLRVAFANHVTQSSAETRRALHTEADTDSESWGRSITLNGEHDEVQEAIHHAQGAVGKFLDRVLTISREAFPREWRTLHPSVPTIASWVGYDLDGRTDIQWTDSIAFRLKEKAAQLSRYGDQLEGIMSAHGPSPALQLLKDRLTGAVTLTSAQADALLATNGDPKKIVAAANLITAPHQDRLIDASEITNTLSAIIARDDNADSFVSELIKFRGMVEALQLGTARIHLRLNAAQMTSVIKRDLGLEMDSSELGRLAMSSLADRTATVSPIPVSFADLHFEQATARRQFMMCAILLNHVDAGAPIRFLIAESENPTTVLGALYLARLYGVAKKLDISPLFETPDALSSGARFMERLLEDPTFLEYIKERGYMSIQLGFSDAGRFVGQIAADMAIERLHNLIGRALSEKAPGRDLLIFNTHGESIGRGAFPGTFQERFDHLLTPWTRAQNAKRNVNIRHEMSFQGGDGFLHFANDELADASYSAICQHLLFADNSKAVDDPFYKKTDFVWDFYRALKAWQESLLRQPAYDNLLSDFASGFLVRAGSRQTRRGGARGPRSLRAISHNATLQQLGVPLNSSAGFGSALPKEADRLVELVNNSQRMQHLLRLALAARLATSVPSLRGYAQVFNPSLWSGYAHQATDGSRQQYTRVFESVRGSATTSEISSIADTLSIDLLAFDSLLSRIESAPTISERHERRLGLHVLHAIRQALMMRALVLSASLPTFSDRNGVNIDEISSMVQSMHLDTAVEALRKIFPASLDPNNEFDALIEQSDKDVDHSYGYDLIHRQIIEPLSEIAQMLRFISLSLCHAYGAYG